MEINFKRNFNTLNVQHIFTNMEIYRLVKSTSNNLLAEQFPLIHGAPENRTHIHDLLISYCCQVYKY
jgi:hypothetical protein